MERLWADFALLLAAQHEVVTDSIDSKPLGMCLQTPLSASADDRSYGLSTRGAVCGFKLHEL